MPATKRADVWVLLGPHRGDNHQVLALAEGLGVPFRPSRCAITGSRICLRCCAASPSAQLQPEARAEIAPPWPSLVIGIGQRSAPVARYIKQASGGRATIVRLGDPMVSPRFFDLVITTTQYAVRDAENVVRLPVTITNPPIAPDPAEARWLEAFPRPRRLIARRRRDVAVAAQALDDLRAARTLLAQARPRRRLGDRRDQSPDVAAPCRRSARRARLARGRRRRFPALQRAAQRRRRDPRHRRQRLDVVRGGRGRKAGRTDPARSQPDRQSSFALAEAVRGRAVPDPRPRPVLERPRARGLVGTVEQPRCGTLDADALETRVRGSQRRARRPAARDGRAHSRSAGPRARPQPATG